MAFLHFGRNRNSISGYSATGSVSKKNWTGNKKGLISNRKIQAAVFSDVGCAGSKNEDNYILGRRINEQFLDYSEFLDYHLETNEKYCLTGVFDGIGGGELGEIASKIAAECFRDSAERISAGLSKEKIDYIIRGGFF